MVHQLMTLDAVVVANVTTVVAVTGEVGPALERCFPPMPNITMKVIALGTHATLSYLAKNISEFYGQGLIPYQ
jgi:hypothetical protein